MAAATTRRQKLVTFDNQLYRHKQEMQGCTLCSIDEASARGDYVGRLLNGCVERVEHDFTTPLTEYCVAILSHDAAGAALGGILSSHLHKQIEEHS